MLFRSVHSAPVTFTVNGTINSYNNQSVNAPYIASITFDVDNASLSNRNVGSDTEYRSIETSSGCQNNPPGAICGNESNYPSLVIDWSFWSPIANIQDSGQAGWDYSSSAMSSIKFNDTYTLNPNFENWTATKRYSRTLYSGEGDRKSTRLNSSHIQKSRMPSSA